MKKERVYFVAERVGYRKKKLNSQIGYYFKSLITTNLTNSGVFKDAFLKGR